MSPDAEVQTNDVVFRGAQFTGGVQPPPQIDVTNYNPGPSPDTVYPYIRYGFKIELLQHVIELDIEFEVYLTYASDTVQFGKDPSKWYFNISPSSALQNLENLHSSMLSTNGVAGNYLHNVFMAWKATTAAPEAHVVLMVRPEIVNVDGLAGRLNTVVGMLTVSVAAITLSSKLEPIRRSLGGWSSYKYRKKGKHLPVWKHIDP
nr:hypothetical protein [Lasius neglectus virus 3]